MNATVSGAPALDIAKALNKYTNITDQCLLAWFRSDSIDCEDTIKIRCVDADESLTPTLETLSSAEKIINEYDIIQTYNPHSAFYAKILGKKNGKRIVSREGNDHASFTRKGRIANGLTNVLVDQVVCVSDAVYNSFLKWEHSLLNAEDVSIIYNGVPIEEIQSKNINWELNEECDVSRDSVIVSHAGRLTEQKAQDVLIRAVAQANNQTQRDIELVIAGDGELRGQLQSLAQKIGFDTDVHFLGFIEQQEVYNMMRQSDLYCMPSRWEGFSMAVLQAMAAVTPCVLSEIPPFEPFRDVAEFAEVDNVEEMSNVIKGLANDEDYRKDLGKRSQELVRNEYSIQKTAQEYAELYAKIVS